MRRISSLADMMLRFSVSFAVLAAVLTFVLQSTHHVHADTETISNRGRVILPVGREVIVKVRKVQIWRRMRRVKQVLHLLCRCPISLMPLMPA